MGGVDIIRRCGCRIDAPSIKWGFLVVRRGKERPPSDPGSELGQGRSWRRRTKIIDGWDREEKERTTVGPFGVIDRTAQNIM